MILICGRDRPIIDAIRGTLEATNRAVEEVGNDQLSDGSFFERLLRTRPQLVFVDAVNRVGVEGQAGNFRDIIRAASVSGVPKFVIVTSRPDTDADLVALRRSGCPYSILRVRKLLDVDTAAAAHLITSPRVVVSKGLLERAKHCSLVTDVAEAVVRELENESAGITTEVESDPDGGCLLALLRRLGAKPAVGTLRGSFWTILGKPRLHFGDSGELGILDRAPRSNPMDEPVHAVVGG